MDNTIEIKYGELVVWVSVGLATFVVVFGIIFHGRECRQGLRAAWRLVGPAFFGFISTTVAFLAYFALVIYDVLSTLHNAYDHLPFAWYILATQTILPIFYSIPQSYAILYLAAYCIVALYICVTLQRPTAPKTAPLAPENRMASQFFSGLRITSVL
jgi:hypothetical protein